MWFRKTQSNACNEMWLTFAGEIHSKPCQWLLNVLERDVQRKQRNYSCFVQLLNHECIALMLGTLLWTPGKLFRCILCALIIMTRPYHIYDMYAQCAHVSSSSSPSFSHVYNSISQSWHARALSTYPIILLSYLTMNHYREMMHNVCACSLYCAPITSSTVSCKRSDTILENTHLPCSLCKQNNVL